MHKKFTSIAVLIGLLTSFLSPAPAAPAYAKRERTDSTQTVSEQVTQTVSSATYQPAKTGKLLIKFKDAEAGREKISKKNKRAAKPSQRLPLIATEALTGEELTDLQNDPNVEYIEMDSTVTKTGDAVPENLEQIGVPVVHKQGDCGSGVKVAVLDTGIDIRSDELNIAGGVSFVPDHLSYNDDNGHGTHVAGILAAVKDGKGLIGVSPDVRLYAVKVLDEHGVGTYSQVIQGIEWAVDNGMDIVVMSFSGLNYSIALEEMVRLAEQSGVMLFAAAGNDGRSDAVAYPAKYPSVIAVGAVDQDNRHASFSNTGNEVELVAPGVSIQSLWLNNRYQMLSGTSAAVPHAAGVAALVKRAHPDWTSSQIRQYLHETTVNLGDPKLYGYGLVNAETIAAELNQDEDNAGRHAHRAVSNKKKLSEDYRLSEAQIQHYLDQGSTLTDIEEALTDRSSGSGKKKTSDLGEQLKKVKPRPINNSSEAASRVDINLEGETSVTRDVYGSERIQLTDWTFNPTSVTSVVYDVYGTEPSVSEPFVTLAATTTDDYNPDGYRSVNTKPDQAPFSVNIGAENISTLTGGFSLSAADLTLPGRNGLSFILTRTYDSGEARFYGKDLELVYKGDFSFSYDYTAYTQYMQAGAITGISAKTTYNNKKFSYDRDEDYYDHWNWVRSHAGESGIVISGWSAPDANGVQSRQMVDIPSDPDLTLIEHDETFLTYRDRVVQSVSEKKIPVGLGWDWNIPYVEKRTITKVGTKYYLHLGEKGTYEIEDGKLVGYPWKDLELTGNSSGYVVTTLEGIQYTFNGSNLRTITDKYNNTITFSYTTHETYGNVLSSITDAIGNQITIAYFPDRVEAALGDRKVIYRKKAVDFYYPNAPWKNVTKELLASVEDSLGRKTTYSYGIYDASYSIKSTTPALSNPYALMTVVTYPTGARTDYTYEAKPVVRSGPKTVDQVYRVASRKDVVTNEDQSQTVFNSKTFSYVGDVGGSNYQSDYYFSTTIDDGQTTTTFENVNDYVNDYEPQQTYHNRTIQSDGTTERITTYGYDTIRKHTYPISTTEYVRTTVNGATVESEPVTTSTTYDLYGHVLTSTDPLGGTSYNQYDPASHLLASSVQPLGNGQTITTVYERNAQGSVTQVQRFGDTMRQINYEHFDAYGNATRIRVQDAEGDNVYDVEFGSASHYAFPTKQTINVTNADGGTSTIVREYAYNTITGQLGSYTDGKQYTTSYRYDALGRFTEVHYPDHTRATVAYDDVNNEITFTDETGVQTYVRWNPLGLKIEEGLVENGQKKLRMKYGYDSYSRLVWAEDALGQRTLYAYDAWGRQKEVTAPDSSKTVYSYDDINHTQTVTDPEGNTWINTYDKLNRLLKKEEVQNGQPVLLESYAYDHVGNVIEKTDGKLKTTRYNYNAFGALTAVTDPEGNKTSYSYSPTGKLIETQYADGTKLKKQYDQMGRLIRKISGVAADTRAEEVYTVDTILNQWSLYKTDTGEVIPNRGDLWSLANGHLTSGTAQTHAFRTHLGEKKFGQLTENTMADYGLGANNLSAQRSAARFPGSLAYYLPDPQNMKLPLQLDDDVDPQVQAIPGMLFFKKGYILYAVASDQLEPRITEYNEWYTKYGSTIASNYRYSGNPYKYTLKYAEGSYYDINDYVVTENALYVVYSNGKLVSYDPYTGAKIAETSALSGKLMADYDNVVIWGSAQVWKLDRWGTTLANQPLTRTSGFKLSDPFQGPDGSYYVLEYDGTEMYVRKIHRNFSPGWRTQLAYGSYKCGECSEDYTQPAMIMLPEKNQLVVRSRSNEPGSTERAIQYLDLTSGAVVRTVQGTWSFLASPPSASVNWKGDVVTNTRNVTREGAYVSQGTLYDSAGAAQGTILKDHENNHPEYSDADETTNLFEGFVRACFQTLSQPNHGRSQL